MLTCRVSFKMTPVMTMTEKNILNPFSYEMFTADMIKKLESPPFFQAFL